MSLKINNFKKYLPRIFLGLIISLSLLALLKVALWEKQYYADQQKIIRQPQFTTETPEQTAVDEAEVSEETIQTYTVPQDQPRYFSIPKLGVTNARILEIGVTKTGALDAPLNIFDVGWYYKSAKPGSGGTLLMDGHNGGPTKHGVFKELHLLNIGDEIIVERGDGKIFRYQVLENKKIPLEEADNYMAKMEQSPIAGQESLSLITCTGSWSNSQQTYLSRQFLRAVIK